MIAREWHGAVRMADKTNYLEYLKNTGVKDYLDTKGNLGVQILNKDKNGVAHFYIITFWESLEAVKSFAGEHYHQARYYPEDHQYLLEMEPEVTHYNVVLYREPEIPFSSNDYLRNSDNHSLGYAIWTK